MDGNGRKDMLTANQLRVIPHLLASPSVEDGCKKARIGKTRLYEWLKDDAFKEELRRQRAMVVENALGTLKANVTKATETLVKLLDSEKEAIQARAAEDIIEFTQKAMESEDLEKRVAGLEEKIKGYEKGWQ